MTFDDELRRSLASRPAPAGFEDRVLAAWKRSPARPNTPPTRSWRPLVTAAALVMLAGAGVAYHEHRATVDEAAEATRQTREALSIASDILARVQERVRATTERTQ